jgi:trehalose 6-phosphate synthase
MGWTKDRLEEVARTRIGGAKLIVVANREPYIHARVDGEVKCIRPASGLTTALDPVMRACGGVWVAHGSGSADREASDARGRIGVPPDDPAYVLRRVWLTKEEEEGYYYGFANSTLWPLCHQAYCRPTFDPAHWETYRSVNEQFAAAVLEEARGGPALVFVQDYHFALLPKLLKDARPDLVVAQFWHIPWPNPETFGVCPWAAQILEGMLGNDLMSFHTQYHCNNFLDTVDRTLECRIEADHFTVARGGHETRVRPHPISVDPDLADEYLGTDWDARAAALRARLGVGDRPLLVGVDRIDYTKGIPERLRAVGRLLDKEPGLKGTFHFVQVGAPSRTTLPAYKALHEEVRATADAVNARHGTADWRPVVFLGEHVGPETIFPLYRTAAGCVVSSLHDGMNLVAKEFVAARGDEAGVLVLSQFTGAARTLTDAVLVNPYDLDGLAAALHTALTMPAADQQRRMRRMRVEVVDHNIYRWAGMLLSDAGRLVEAVTPAGDEPDPVRPGPHEETLDQLLDRATFQDQTWLAWGS